MEMLKKLNRIICIKLKLSNTSKMQNMFTFHSRHILVLLTILTHNLLKASIIFIAKPKKRLLINIRGI